MLTPIGNRYLPSADVWALGSVLYRLLSGRYPHDGDTLQEMLVSITTGQIAPLTTSPTTPTSRYASAPPGRSSSSEPACAAPSCPPPAPTFCKFQEVSRAAVGASPSKPALHFNLLYEASSARYIWNIDYSIRLDAQTCAPVR